MEYFVSVTYVFVSYLYSKRCITHVIKIPFILFFNIPLMCRIFNVFHQKRVELKLDQIHLAFLQTIYAKYIACLC